jgi:2-amino-4-hydroxy-6-hydroxymethyldihydropteridine diphosphokinase
MGSGPSHLYLVALGSNMRHARFTQPDRVVRAALNGLTRVIATSRIIASRPVGPSLRTYANCVAVLESDMEPREMLDTLQAMETAFGRKRRGSRWRARPLDLDIILWSGGCWRDTALTIPHPEFRSRPFVLAPAREVAQRWRDPVSGKTIAQLWAKCNRTRVVLA